jgi:hypothetical protein
VGPIWFASTYMSYSYQGLIYCVPVKIAAACVTSSLCFQAARSLGMTLCRRVTCRHSHRLPQELGLFLQQCLAARGVLPLSQLWFQNARSPSIRNACSCPSPGPLVVRFLLVAMPYTAGAPAKHHAAIMGHRWHSSRRRLDERHKYSPFSREPPTSVSPSLAHVPLEVPPAAPPLAAEGQQQLFLARVTAKPQKAMGQDAALQVVVKLTFEVTQGQWQAVMGNNPSSFKGDANRPVEYADRRFHPC